MITISYKVSGADAILRELVGFRLDALRGDIDTVMDEIAADAADYPSELPGQRYIRTGDLGRGWTDSAPMFQGDADSLLSVLTNPVSYGPNVMGVDDQAKIHQGRWRTNEQIMDAWEARVTAAVERALDKVLPR